MSDTVDYGEWCNGKRLGTVRWHAVCAQTGVSLGALSAGCWLMADMMRQKSAEQRHNSIIIALFTIVPAICYLLSAIIAKRYYSLTTHNLKTVMEQLAQGKRRCQQHHLAQN